MELGSWLRVVLIFAHLLLCGYALYLVIRTDLLVLRRRVSSVTLLRVHSRVVTALSGLWLTGLSVVVLDLWPDLSAIVDKPKLMAKLVCVLALTLNAFVLRNYCFPRLVADRALKNSELRLLAAVGAVSATSWLAAAFIGVAKPIAALSLWQALALYGLLVLAGVALSQIVGPRRLAARRPSTGHTALEQAAETLDLRPRA